METALLEDGASLVGRRVRVNGNLATVRWGPGELQGPPPKKKPPADVDDASGYAPETPAMMRVVGIEYDSPGLGKHDGTYQDRRLFFCKAGHGSFAKVEKVEFGVPLQTALAEKYFAALRDGAATRERRTEWCVPAGETVAEEEGGFAMEMVGRYEIEQRQKELEAFKEMSLAETNVETRYPETVWNYDWSLPNLKSLWLDKTLIAEWADIVSICQLCPRLEWLSLARTRLKPLPQDGIIPLPVGAAQTPDSRIARGSFACRVQTLVLSNTGITWEDIFALEAAGCFPCLEHLHLAQNDLTQGVPTINSDSRLQLDCSQCAYEPPASGEDEECAICLESFTNKTLECPHNQAGAQMVYKLRCNHKFHTHCLESYLNRAPGGEGEGPIGHRCPSCREPMPVGQRALPRLKTLMLDSNGISDWFVLQRACRAFPTLESLHLNCNSLGGTLQGLADVAADATPRFLTSLYLNENQLSSWQAVGALSSYALLELKVQRNPLTESDCPVASPQLLRQILIALMPTLRRLNASEVTAKERTAAERYFLALLQNLDHPIVRALGETCSSIHLHAERLRAAYADVAGELIVEVTLCPFGAAILDQAPLKKTVPHSMTIHDLKVLAWKEFQEKIPLDRVQILLIDPSVPFGTPFPDEGRELGFYGVQDGARFRIDDAGDAQGDKLLKQVDNLEKMMLAEDT